MEFSDIRLGIIGCGRWGINHVKTAYSLLGSDRVSVFDSDPAAVRKVNAVAEGISFTVNKTDVIHNPAINAVVIATPAETHYQVAKECLEHGKHVLIEKPITLCSSDARELVALAQAKDLRIMVGHVLLYHPAIKIIKEYIEQDKIGRLQYIYSNRLNLGAIRTEENILWSFAPHDISIIQYLTSARPISIDAKGAKFVQDHIEDMTLTVLEYPDNVHAHIFVSWLHPFKEHRLVVIGDRGMIVFEDSLPEKKLKYYEKGFARTSNGIEKFESDFVSIPFDNLQPLTEEHKHFYRCIIDHTTPLTDGDHALEVLEILEQATGRLKNA